MRIAQIAPLDLRVPPAAYGGTELVVSLLTEELIRRGHEVTLFASGDSVTAASLRSVCPHMLRGSAVNAHDALIYRLLNAMSPFEQAPNFDIIHNHTFPEGMAMANLAGTPVLATLHGGLSEPGRALLSAYKGYYNTISKSAKSLLPDKEGFVGVIYNAINCKSFPFSARGGDDLLFLSRISQEKGPHIAIEVAKRLGRRLIIAGNVDTVDEEYFKQRIMSQVDSDIVQYFGEAGYEEKRELFANAHCLLMPITWPEPFGLVMVEAMACGTPVIASNKGAAPEIVLDGETGFIVENVEQMVEAVGEVNRIDRSRCREHVERNFDVPRMVDDYLRAYNWILETGGGRRAIPDMLPKLAPSLTYPGRTSDHKIPSGPMSKN
ncbi:D-inositol-3-phosphate glycosyltransferase [subsurface metagenome]